MFSRKKIPTSWLVDVGFVLFRVLFAWLVNQRTERNERLLFQRIAFFLVLAQLNKRAISSQVKKK